MNTPEIITTLKENEIFVFGSNTQGRHGGGAAKLALDKFGAIYGQAFGLQGQSYAIVTTDLYNNCVISKDHIYWQIISLYLFAKRNPKLTFYVTKIGCGLAGFTISEISAIFMDVKYYFNKNTPTYVPLNRNIPTNIILPKEFE